MKDAGPIRFGLIVALIASGMQLVVAPFTGDPGDMGDIPLHFIALILCLIGLAILARKENP